MTPENVQLILNIVSLLALVGGGYIIVFKMGKAVNRFESVATMHGEAIKDLKESLKLISEAVMRQAIQEERITQISKRQTSLEATVKELQHGEGFIFPLGSIRPAPRND